MADVFLTLKQIETLFWESTMQVLGYDPDDYNNPTTPPNSMPVRISWPTDGAPSWKITDNVVFLRVAEDEDPINVLRDIILQTKDDGNATQSTGQTRVIRVHWLCYGPDSYENAFTIRNSLYIDDYRTLLSDSKVYLIPGESAPKRMPELFSGRWWERVDFSANFNEFVKLDITVPYLKSAEITVKDSPISGTTNVTDSSVSDNTLIHSEGD